VLFICEKFADAVSECGSQSFGLFAGLSAIKRCENNIQTGRGLVRYRHQHRGSERMIHAQLRQAANRADKTFNAGRGMVRVYERNKGKVRACLGQMDAQFPATTLDFELVQRDAKTERPDIGHACSEKRHHLIGLRLCRHLVAGLDLHIKMPEWARQVENPALQNAVG